MVLDVLYRQYCSLLAVVLAESQERRDCKSELDGGVWIELSAFFFTFQDCLALACAISPIFCFMSPHQVQARQQNFYNLNVSQHI